MMKVSALLTTLIATCMGAAILVVLSLPAPTLSTSELIQALVSIVAASGALISAVYVVSGYRQSIRTFHEANRPHLLFQIENRHEMIQDLTSPVPITVIHYRNISTNQLRDLTFSIVVEAYDKTIDISDLFRANMTMPGWDQRLRRFKPVEYLNAKGVHLNTVVEGEDPPRMTVRYQYRYAGETEEVLAQEYFWNAQDQIWEIL